MRTLLATALLAGLVAGTAAQDARPAAKIQPAKAAPQDQPKKPEAALKIGDPAPPLRATKWLQGTEVKEFAKDRIYVVEFWATWCGPCIVMMPHMGEMQTEYRSKGVTFIGFSAQDPNNSLEKVAAMVEKRGKKLGYTFAFADNRETYDSWMRAAGQSGIPCCFVVGKTSKIEYIGHPMYLDIVLPKVVAGTWKGAAEMAAMDQIEADLTRVFGSFGGDPEVGLKTLADFEARYPALNDVPYFRGPRLDMMIKSKKYDEAKKSAEALIAKGIKQEDPIVLRTVSSVLRSPAAKDQKDLLTLSVKAAEAGVKVAGDKDAMALLNVAESYFATGDKAKAQEYGKKALAAAEADSPAVKKYIEGQVKKYDE
jgi:thiol-disulfide isomerase/thioredoxin